MSEESEVRGRKNPKMLTDREKLTLWNFLRGIEGQIRAEDLDRHAIARMARESTGLEVNWHHVVHAADTLGIKLGRKQPERTGKPSKGRQVLDALTVRVEQLETRLAGVEDDLRMAL
jgi:hypothetical protein